MGFVDGRQRVKPGFADPPGLYSTGRASAKT